MRDHLCDLPTTRRANALSGSRSAALWFFVLAALPAVGVARAAELPISGIYGTVAMCIIDAFNDIPPGDVNFNAGGAPLAHVTSAEFDTPRESCAFGRLMSQSDSGKKLTWVVEADCTGRDGNLSKVLKITNDVDAKSLQITAEDGTFLAVLDQCSISYAERLSRELKRISAAPKK